MAQGTQQYYNIYIATTTSHSRPPVNFASLRMFNMKHERYNIVLIHTCRYKDSRCMRVLPTFSRGLHD